MSVLPVQPHLYCSVAMRLPVSAAGASSHVLCNVAWHGLGCLGGLGGLVVKGSVAVGVQSPSSDADCRHEMVCGRNKGLPPPPPMIACVYYHSTVPKYALPTGKDYSVYIIVKTFTCLSTEYGWPDRVIDLDHFQRSSLVTSRITLGRSNAKIKRNILLIAWLHSNSIGEKTARQRSIVRSNKCLLSGTVPVQAERLAK